MKIFRLIFPALLLWSGIVTSPAKDRQPIGNSADTSELNYRQFSLLAIQDGGRKKPIDTFATDALVSISGGPTYTDTTGRMWWPKDFLLSAWVGTHDWRNEPLIFISLGKLKEHLGLPVNQRRFSYAQLTALTELSRLAREGQALRDAAQPSATIAREAVNLSDHIALLDRIMDGNTLLIVPPPNGDTDLWVGPRDAHRYYSDSQLEPVRTDIQAMLKAYRHGDTFQFSRSSRSLRDSLRSLNPGVYPLYSQLRLEYFYNHLEAFSRAIWLYCSAFVLLLIAHLRGRGTALRNIGLGVAFVGAASHTIGIVLQYMVIGRVSATNWYELMICSVLAVILLSAIFFARYRTPVYLMTALPLSLFALLPVHNVPVAAPVTMLLLVIFAMSRHREYRAPVTTVEPAEIASEQVAA